MEHLPIEIVLKILKILPTSDLLIASQVCQVWRNLSIPLIADIVSVMLTDDITPVLDVFINSVVPYKTWVFKEVDFQSKGKYLEFWNEVASSVETLMLLNIDITESDFFTLLKQCCSLKELGLNGLSHMLMTGNLLSNPEDRELLKTSLQNVTSLHLACSRYLTDAIFSRITYTLGPIFRLSLAGCQISYQNAIYKRFYPQHLEDQPSENVLTFKHILKYIEKNVTTLKEISLGRTSVDSTSLQSIAALPGLELSSVHLMSCDQLTKAGIEQLSQFQRNIIDLDLSLCSRLTDYAILAIAEHLPRIKILRIRRCRGITESGIKALKKLKYLETLDISHLENITSEGINEALCSNNRPTLHWLNISSIPVDTETLIKICECALNLKHLNASMCVAGANDKSVKAICEHLTKLEVLNLNGCIMVSDVGLSGVALTQEESTSIIDTVKGNLSLENLGLRNKDLVELNLCGCARITDITLVNAFRFKQLKNLNLSHCQQVTEEGLTNMALNCPSLETLSLTECSHITDQTVLAFSYHLKRLKNLDMQNCVNLTDDSLDSLGNCLSLIYLEVSGCLKMSLEQIEKLQLRLPRLHNLHHRGIRAKSQEGRKKEEIFNTEKVLPTPPPLLSKLKKKISLG